MRSLIFEVGFAFLSFDLIKEMNLGSGLESSVLKGITATLAGYYNTDRINFTVDNNNYSSWHIWSFIFHYAIIIKA